MCTVKQLLLISESTVPLKIPFQPVIPCTKNSPQSLSVPYTYPLCHLSAPSITCTYMCIPYPRYPFSAIPCTPNVTPSLLLSSLVHVSVTPVSPVILYTVAGCSVKCCICSLYKVILAVTNREIKLSINKLVHEMNFEMYSVYYNNAPVVCISLRIMHLQNTYFYFNYLSHSIFLS